MPLNTQGKKQQFPEIMTAKAGAELATNLQGFLKTVLLRQPEAKDDSSKDKHKHRANLRASQYPECHANRPHLKISAAPLPPRN
jgi:hypothetical protein